MTSFGTPRAEHEIDDELVRKLLQDQHPDLADAEIVLLDVGWDNANYRVGESNVVRLPRRQLAATLIENEQTWLPVLAESLPIAVPRASSSKARQCPSGERIPSSW